MNVHKRIFCKFWLLFFSPPTVEVQMEEAQQSFVSDVVLSTWTHIFPKLQIRTLGDACPPDCVALYRTSRVSHLLLFLPQWSAALSFFSPPTNFSTLTLFYVGLAALPMCFIPPFLLTGRENDEEDELTTTVAGTKRKLERLQLKMLFFSLFLIIFCPPVSSFAVIHLLISATDIICSHCTQI